LKLDNKRWIEFFAGEGNQLSMMRLMVFSSFFPASYVVCYLRSTESLAVYLGAYVTGYVGGKTTDIIGRKRNNVIPISKPNKKS
jgi:hypothetical protein